MREKGLTVKVVATIFAIMICFTLVSVSTVDAADEVPIYLDEERVDFPDAKPFIDSNKRTQVPARFIAEELGADVSWNGEEQKATFKLDDTTVEVVIGKSQYYINGLMYEMDTEALVKENRTFVPIRYISEALGQEVVWDDVKKAVTLRPYKKPIWLTIDLNEKRIVTDDGYQVRLDYDTASFEFSGELLIAVEPLAEALDGQYYLDLDSQVANLRVLGNDFEMKLYEDDVVVNGKKQQSSTDVVYEETVFAPASLFKSVITDYDISIVEKYDFLMKQPNSGDINDAYGSYSVHNYKDVSKVTKKYVDDLPEDVAEISDEIIESLNIEEKSDYEKLVAVNDYIISNTVYDHAKAELIVDGDYSGDAGYSVLRTKTGVCHDYAVAAAVLLNRIGVETRYVAGAVNVDPKNDVFKYGLAKLSAMQYHAWNIVKIDGNYYHVDMTWNDAEIDKGDGLEQSMKSKFDYFMLSDKQLGEERLWLREYYPACTTTFSADTINQLPSSDYEYKELVVKTHDGLDAKEDIVIEMYTSYNTYHYRRKIVLPKGESERSYMIIEAKSEVRSPQAYNESLRILKSIMKV